jgi:hypothetical protein
MDFLTQETGNEKREKGEEEKGSLKTYFELFLLFFRSRIFLLWRNPTTRLANKSNILTPCHTERRKRKREGYEMCVCVGGGGVEPISTKRVENLVFFTFLFFAWYNLSMCIIHCFFLRGEENKQKRWNKKV